MLAVPIGDVLPAAASAPPPAAGCALRTATFTNSTPVAIPTGPAVVSSNIVVSGAGAYLRDADVQTFITHTFAADLDVTVQSPAGTVVTLTTDNGASNDNVFNGTVWDDDANPAGQVPYLTDNGLATDHVYVNLTLASPLVPEEAMGAFIGENPNGTWTLTVSDDLAGDGGSVDSWALTAGHAGRRAHDLGGELQQPDRCRHSDHCRGGLVEHRGGRSTHVPAGRERTDVHAPHVRL